MEKTIGVTSEITLSFDYGERAGQVNDLKKVAKELSNICETKVEFSQDAYAVGYVGFFIVKK
jgi:hypothetical protein